MHDSLQKECQYADYHAVCFLLKNIIKIMNKYEKSIDKYDIHLYNCIQ